MNFILFTRSKSLCWKQISANFPQNLFPWVPEFLLHRALPIRGDWRKCHLHCHSARVGLQAATCVSWCPWDHPAFARGSWRHSYVYRWSQQATLEGRFTVLCHCCVKSFDQYASSWRKRFTSIKISSLFKDLHGHHDSNIGKTPARSQVIFPSAEFIPCYKIDEICLKTDAKVNLYVH
jgi:hypothetical protein